MNLFFKMYDILLVLNLLHNKQLSRVCLLCTPQYIMLITHDSVRGLCVKLREMLPLSCMTLYFDRKYEHLETVVVKYYWFRIIR